MYVCVFVFNWRFCQLGKKKQIIENNFFLNIANAGSWMRPLALDICLPLVVTSSIPISSKGRRQLKFP